MNHNFRSIKILGLSSVPRDTRMDFKNRLPEQVISRLYKQIFFFRAKESMFYYFGFLVGIMAQLLGFLRHARKTDCVLCFVPQLLPFALLARRPVIFVAVDDYEGDVYTRKLKKLVFYFIKRFFVVKTHLVVCTTQYIASRYTHMVPRDKIRVIRVGVDCNFFRPEQPFQPFQSSAGKKAILYYHGKLRTDYNTDFLLKVLKHVQTPAELWLVGDGPQYPTLKELSKRLNLQDRVKFFGKTPFEDLPNLMHKANIFLNPIPILGSKLYQYFAAMRPVVSLCGLVNEIAKHEKEFLCVNQAPLDYAMSIDQLLSAPELQSHLVNNARKKIESQDWFNILSKYKNAISDVLQVEDNY